MKPNTTYAVTERYWRAEVC